MIDGFTIGTILIFDLLLIVFVGTMKDLKDPRNLVLKLLLTATLLVLTVYLGWNDIDRCQFLIFGIVASMLGDLSLGLFRKSELNNWNCYLLGVAFFLVAQIMYIIHISIRDDTFPIASFGLAIVAVIGFIMINREIVLKNKYALYSMPYSLGLITTLFASILCLFNGHMNHNNGIFALGMVLFFVSDAILFDIVFKKYDLKKDYVNKISYFIGQLFIVLSLVG